MEFCLTYRGPLRAANASNKRKKDKQEIRRNLHSQLEFLWKQSPLDHIDPSLRPNSSEKKLVHEVSGFAFFPLICEPLCLVAELDITILRPEPPGAIITQSGDIDNRLKTLFDGLKIPTIGELPSGDGPMSGETPFYCLLEDDNLITRISVTTERLLEPSKDTAYVELLIRVKTKPTRVTLGNLVLL